MTELQTKWIRAIEDYYRDTYPATMRKKVGEILPTGEKALQALYDTLIRSVEARYRTVPDVIAIQQCMNEVWEAYPELSAPDVPLLQDAPPGTSAAEWFHLFKEALSLGINPKEYTAMREWLKRKGVALDD